MNDSMPHSNKLILIVDDDEDIVYYYQSLLSPFYRVLTSYSANEALTIIEKEKPDIVLSDVKMPSKDGIELLNQAKSINEQIVVIMITGVVDIQAAISSVRSHAFDYLEKPVPDEKLFETLHRAEKEVDKYKENIFLSKVDLAKEKQEYFDIGFGHSQKLLQNLFIKYTSLFPHVFDSPNCIFLDDNRDLLQKLEKNLKQKIFEQLDENQRTGVYDDIKSKAISNIIVDVLSLSKRKAIETKTLLHVDPPESESIHEIHTYLLTSVLVEITFFMMDYIRVLRNREIVISYNSTDTRFDIEMRSTAPALSEKSFIRMWKKHTDFTNTSENGISFYNLRRKLHTQGMNLSLLEKESGFGIRVDFGKDKYLKESSNLNDSNMD